MADRIKIAKRTVDALRPSHSRFMAWDSELAGFGVRVAPTGRKTYVFKYRAGGGRGGTSREPVIGVHGAITPDEARRVARAWAAEVAAGGDPAADRHAQREAPRVGELLDRYLTDHAQPFKKASSVAKDRRLIEMHARPALAHRKVAEIKRAEIEKLHKSLETTPYEANRVLALLSKAFSLAERWELRPNASNPCRHVSRYRETKRERFLSERELAALGVALAAAERGELATLKGAAISRASIAAIRLLMFTGARKGEILALRWAEINWQAGRAELPDSKTGRKFLYLPPAALEILRDLDRFEGNPYVFAGGKPGAHLVDLKDPWQAIRAAAGLSDVRLHDLRHSFASVGAGAGMSLPLIGALLGHKEAATTARYAHLSDDPQRDAAALIGGRIAAALNSDVSENGGADVLELGRKPAR